MGREINIAGSGPAGLSCAIVLAKRGFDVTVYEQRSTVGERFNDDFQGLENWSTEFDSLGEIESFGLKVNWWSKPFLGGKMLNTQLKSRQITTNQPLFYMVRRGNQHPASLDVSLFKQASEAGVRFVFNKRLPKQAAHVLATGPRGAPKAVAAGITFTTNLPDLACVVLNEELAPSGYVYFLVGDGKATLATVLFKNFERVHAALDSSTAVVSKLYGLTKFPGLRRWGGYGTFAIRTSFIEDGRLLVGEAGGFQDFLFGFGIRNALLSGALAAISLSEGKNYDELCHLRLIPYLKASAVNRVLYDGFGNLAKDLFCFVVGVAKEPKEFMRSLYSFTGLHKSIYPLLNAGKNAPSLS